MVKVRVLLDPISGVPQQDAGYFGPGGFYQNPTNTGYTWLTPPGLGGPGPPGGGGGYPGGGGGGPPGGPPGGGGWP
eukprot:3380449-Karenia_brevis.AAC.1